MHGNKLATTTLVLALGAALLAGCSKKEDDSTGNTVTDGMGLPSASAPVGSTGNETTAAPAASVTPASPAGATGSDAAASGAAASGAVPGDHDHAATGRVEASDHGAKPAGNQ